MAKIYSISDAKRSYETSMYTDIRASVIVLSVNIVGSKKIFTKLKAIDTIEIIKHFIDYSFSLLNKRLVFEEYIYEGDSIKAICYPDEWSETVYSDVFEAALDLNTFSEDYKSWIKNDFEYDLKIKISIAWDFDTHIEKIMTIPMKYNNNYYVGKSILLASQLSKQNTKDKIANEYPIAVNKVFFDKLKTDEKTLFTYVAKNIYYCNGKWE